jgi:hypothetical protein
VNKVKLTAKQIKNIKANIRDLFTGKKKPALNKDIKLRIFDILCNKVEIKELKLMLKEMSKPAKKQKRGRKKVK